MTIEELHNILDDEDKKLVVSELQEVIYRLKNDSLTEFNNATTKRDEGFYIGEQNAFQICLDLLEHLHNPEEQIDKLKAENENIRQEHIHNSIYAELLEENAKLKKRLENAVEMLQPCADKFYLTREEVEKALKGKNHET